MSERALTVHFSSDVRSLDEWANRLSIPLDTELLAQHYTAAHRVLRQLRTTLVSQYGWTDAGHVERLLFSISAEPPHLPSGLPRGPAMNICLPYHVSSFFTPERRVQWQMVFHSTLFQTMRHTIEPVGILFYLLQCLVPGMLLLTKRECKPEGTWLTSRALPPPDWMDAQSSMLVDIFGSSHYKTLFKAAQNNQVAFKVTMA